MREWEEQQEKDEVSLETKQRAMRGRVGVWTAGPTVAGSIRGKVAEIRRDHLHVALLPFHCGCRVSPPSPADDPSLRVRLLVRAQAKDKAPLELINNPIFSTIHIPIAERCYHHAPSTGTHPVPPKYVLLRCGPPAFLANQIHSQGSVHHRHIPPVLPGRPLRSTRRVRSPSSSCG